ncbi:ankyrin repeat domain-containing protein [Sphingosinicella rhizophila]|uniref:Ankyrin repeat domain-containing protein n=1 Tax=Sphingosinicella rhizophila TaxID=3050082 RepID=A0ABU3Q808_9SPHN|nr:ankyrin repeat domain-containing protein [Sphingosinicella sp. GR2756]MDT9599541.1 ankyrin repeat domain-containing protein [Sphingosinicella sp. GR2756]
MVKRFFATLGTVLALGLLAIPAAAQQVSDSYAFLKAVRDRDGNKVQSLIGSPGATVINTRERGSGEGGLHILARERDLTWLGFLLSRGAKPDIQNENGDTPLGLAAQLGWVDGAEELLRRRASVDLANNRGETPLILAVHARDLPMVRLLLAKGANPKKSDNVAGYSAIDYARQDARTAAILKLLESPPAPPRAVAGPK